ncbi:YcxB family protein [Micromonospora sp. NPDC004704]
MRIEFTHSRSPEYFRSQLTAAARHQVRQILLVAVAAAVVGSLLVLFSQAEGGAAVIGFVALVLAIVLPLRAWRTFQAAVTVPASWSDPRTYLITDEGLESSTEATSSRWGWQAVCRVEERPEAYLFWREGPVVFDLPREPLTADQEAVLRAFLSRRGLLPLTTGAQR